MPTSSLYRIHPESKTLQSVREVNFADHDFRERYDIQEWVEESPSILGERLLIVAKEKTYFDGTNERPNLVAIDEEGNGSYWYRTDSPKKPYRQSVVVSEATTRKTVNR